MINAFILELKEIRNSFFLFSLLTWIPLLSSIIVISIFYKGVATKLPIVVVDNDRSQLSREIIKNINSNQALHVEGIELDIKSASKLIRSSKVYAMVEIPAHFEKDTIQKKQPNITAFVNTQYILIGKMISAALSGTIRESSARVDFANNLINDGQTRSAIFLTAPINVQITPYFNTYKNYFLFLVSAILPTIWQILIVVALIVSFGKTFKEKKEDIFFKNRNIFAAVIGKTLPYTFAYMGWGIMFLLYMYGVQPWEFQGSFALTIFAMFLTLLAYEGVALSFFTINFHQTRALSLAAVYTAPAFAFLGITFPVSSMPEFAHIWHNLLPISHYLKLQISQASYGTPLYEVIPILKNLLYFLPVWFIVIFKIRRKV